MEWIKSKLHGVSGSIAPSGEGFPRAGMEPGLDGLAGSELHSCGGTGGCILCMLCVCECVTVVCRQTECLSLGLAGQAHTRPGTVRGSHTHKHTHAAYTDCRSCRRWGLITAEGAFPFCDVSPESERVKLVMHDDEKWV